MTAPTFFTVVADYKSVVVDLASDVDADPQLGPITAKVTFTPVLAKGDVILATNASPRPTGYIGAPIVARIDTDGRLKLRVEPDGDRDDFATAAEFPETGSAAKVYWAIDEQTFYRWNGADYVETYPYAAVRLLADTALLELDSDLYYRVTFSEVVFNGASGYISPFVFQAPTSDVELNLIEVTPVPGELASGQTKIAPGAVRLNGDSEVVFSFAGVDIPEPLPVVIPGITDATTYGRSFALAEDSGEARTILELGDSFDLINVKHYGVTGDGTTDDAAAIRQVALDNPSRALYFPPGDYKCMTGLTFPNGNSLILAPDARIFAGAAMSILIDHTPNDFSTDGTPEYFQLVMDKTIQGGTLDGNYLANTILKVSRQTGNRITGITFLNPVQRGLWTARPGAEHIVTACTFRNLTDANSSAINTGIYNNSLATHYLDIVITDFNRGVFDDDSAMWTRCHVWLGQASRIADGTVCYETNGSSHFVQCYADTLQTGWKINDAFSQTKITFATFFISDYYYTAELAEDYPPTVLDVATGARVIFTSNTIFGHPAGGTPLVTGYTGKLTASGNFIDDNIVNDQRSEWLDGTQQGKTTFTPTIVGSTVAGTHTYTTRTGTMTVSGNIVNYYITLTATLDSTLSGELQISGIPEIVSPYTSKGGVGPIGFHSGVGDMRMVSHAGGTANFRLWGVNTGTGSSVATSATALRGATVTIFLSLTSWIDQGIDLA